MLFPHRIKEKTKVNTAIQLDIIVKIGLVIIDIVNIFMIKGIKLNKNIIN